MLSQGEEKTFGLSGVGSGCSCVGFEGKTKTCEVIIHAESEYGLEKKFTTSVSVDCVSSAVAANLSAVIQPSSAPIEQDSLAPVISLSNPASGFSTSLGSVSFIFDVKINQTNNVF